jgi:cytochrome c553
MKRHPCAAFAALALLAPAASAQDAARGATLYAALPGNPGVGSCVSCHGDPLNNRNSVLRGAAGAALIGRTINAVGAMGYLRQHLTEADLGDIAAYLASLTPAGALDVLPDPWPGGVAFGSVLAGTVAAPREVLLTNPRPREALAIAGVRVADEVRFSVEHDCPLSLPPLQQCRLRAWFRPQAEGPVSTRFDVLDSSQRVLRSGTLSGTGRAVQPPLLAWGAGTPALIDFDRVAVGSSGEKALVIENRSPQAVPLPRLRVTGAQAARFSTTGSCVAAARLEAGAACTLSITYRPTAPERAEGWMEIEADAQHPPLLRVQALGVAAAPAPGPQPPPPAVPEGGGGGALAVAWVALLALAVTLLRLG